MTTTHEPVVRRGATLCYRLFDVGEEIVLDEAERQLRQASVRKTSIDRPDSGDLEFIAVPLRVELGKRKLSLPASKRELEVEAYVHVYAHGTLSVLFEVPIPDGTALGALTPHCRELYEAEALTAAARAEVDAVLPKLGAAVKDPHDWRGHETYTVIYVSELEGAPRGEEVLAWPGLAKLLVGELSEQPLSAAHSGEVLEHASSYLANDLVVIDWNSAFVLDPTGSMVVVQLLEFANSQLAGLRYYDHVLDADLKRIYAELDAVGKKRSGTMFGGPYARMAHHVFRRLVDITELAERIENTIKVTGHFYTARLYRAATNRLRIAAWHQSITHKQEMVSAVYTMLKDEAHLRLSTMLEITVVILIVIEVVLALMGGH